MRGMMYVCAAPFCETRQLHKVQKVPMEFSLSAFSTPIWLTAVGRICRPHSGTNGRPTSSDKSWFMVLKNRSYLPKGRWYNLSLFFFGNVDGDFYNFLYIEIQCNTLHCNTIRYNTIQYSNYSIVQYCYIIQYNTLECNAIQYIRILCNTIH